MKVLSSAAVGVHGRGDSSRRWRGVVLLLLCQATIAAQPASFEEFVSRIAAALSPNETVSLTASSIDSASEPMAAVQHEMARLLTARGLRVVPPAADVRAITVSCGRNLREELCVAQIQRSGGADVLTIASPIGGRERLETAGGDALQAEPIFGQRAPILDVALVTDRLVVLGRDTIALYRHDRDPIGWRRAASQPIALSRISPRDSRGRLRINASTIEAFLPGAICRAPIELTTITCAEEREPWPLGVENTGIDATRNFFQTPEGTAFFAAATLDDAADARFAIVDISGRMVLLDGTRTALGSVGVSDDIAGLRGACGEGAYIVFSSAEPMADGVTLQLGKIVARRLVRGPTHVTLSGRLTALWAAPFAAVATAVTHDVEAGRYEAFQLRLRCDM